MKISEHANWLREDIQSCIEPQNILIINVELEEECSRKTIKVKMRRNLTMDTSKIYNINISMFKDS